MQALPPVNMSTLLLGGLSEINQVRFKIQRSRTSPSKTDRTGSDGDSDEWYVLVRG